MEKYVILHGHFYQPPREDPWTGLIEVQESAAPYSDWNRRITAECYAAGASSRILDSKGAILSIKNNYSHLSFNFGPTLLSWMETEAPQIYQRILDADRLSVERLGHGNALAQSYNHTILPLDTPEDALTQIRWGISDFTHRFKRPAEGMWLPECAVNEMVIDILIDEGMKFLILSPWQAHSLKKDNGEWEQLNNNPAPADRPFYISRPRGRIAVFFYNSELASSISFGHLLRSREGLEKALRETLDKSANPLVTIATDGEIYGHHEPFGDMCFSALVDNLGENPELIFTNYAAYLESHPPVQEVKLRPGDDKKGTSWSCEHGVGRWFGDCGCTTGGEEGWNQAWRTPLREAFDKLRIQAEPLWTKKIESLTGSGAREILDFYGEVLSGAVSPLDFAENAIPITTGKTLQKQQNLLKLLEGVKFLQFMYTSCGWFFSDLAGLEPVQNMRYAYRAAGLMDSDGSAGLIQSLQSSLSEAKSNIAAKGSGSRILEDSVIPKILPEAKSAAIFFWRNLYNLPDKERTTCGVWKGTEVLKKFIPVDGGGQKLTGSVSFKNVSTLESYNYKIRAFINRHFFCKEVDIAIDAQWLTIPIRTMPTALRMEIQETMLNESEDSLKDFLGSKANQRLRDLLIVQTLNVPFGASGWQSLELSLHYGPLLILDQLEKTPAENWEELLLSLEEILTHRDTIGMDADNGSVEKLSGKLVSRVAGILQKRSNREALEQLVIFLEILHRHGLQPLKPFVQNAVYILLEERCNCDEKNGLIEDECPSNNDLIDLARLVNINPERFGL